MQFDGNLEVQELKKDRLGFISEFTIVYTDTGLEIYFLSELTIGKITHFECV